MVELAFQINNQLEVIRENTQAINTQIDGLKSSSQVALGDALVRVMALLQGIQANAESALAILKTPALKARAGTGYGKKMKEHLDNVKNVFTLRIKGYVLRQNILDLLRKETGKYKSDRLVPDSVREAVLKVAHDLKIEMEALDALIEQNEPAVVR